MNLPADVPLCMPMHEYYFGRLLLRSSLELPELCPISAEGPPTTGVCSVQVVNDGLDPDFVASHTDVKDGVVILRRAVDGDTITLRLDDAADFVVSADRDHVSVSPSRSMAASTVRHNLLDQVLPRVLDGLGHFVLHASGVETKSGGLLFLGDSGAGKSSLAAEFERTGSRLMGDDCFVISKTDDQVSALSTYPSLRLLPDSIAHMFKRTSVDLSEVAADRTKQRVAQDRLTPPAAADIAALFIIDLTKDHHGPPEVHRLSSRDAMLHLVKNSFRLDPSPRSAHRALIDAENIITAVPMYELRYERRYNQLKAVQQAILTIDEFATT